MNTQLQTTQSNPVAIAPSDVSLSALECALAGNLARLNVEERLKYIARTCELVGLNPLTKPFDIMEFQGKTVLYANKSCAEQLRKLHQVSVEILERKVEFGCLIVRCKATDGSGRHDEAIAAVPFNEKNPDLAANAMMKAETKAKRRVTFSICGLGFAADRDDLPSHEVAPVVNSEQSASSLAHRLNASLTEGEKSQAIPVAAAPEPVEVKPVVAKPVEVEVVKEVAKPTPGGLGDEMVANLEIVLSEAGPEGQAKAVKYLISKGKLRPMEGLDRINKEAAEFIMKNPQRFQKMVAEWQPK